MKRLVFRLRVKPVLVFTGAVCLVIFAQSQSVYFPDGQWQTRKPAEVGMQAARLDSAIRFALRNESKTETDVRIALLKAYANEPEYKILGPTRPRGGPAGMIIRNGYLIGSWGDLDRVDMCFSVTKSFLSTAVGWAADQKLIRSVDDPVKNYVWSGEFDSPHNRKITWRHLLTQSSDWSGCQFGICDWADRPPREGSVDDWKRPALNEPGTRYEYNDVRVNLLAYALLQVVREPLPMLMREKIMNPIGASSTWRWYGYENSYVPLDGTQVQSVSGGGHFGGGLFISTADLARFGLLITRNGKWKNQQVISESWIAEARLPSAPNKKYGFLWWLNQDRWQGVPSEVFSAEGFGGHFVVIDPVHDLVIVARWLEPGQAGEFVARVLKSLEKR